MSRGRRQERQKPRDTFKSDDELVGARPVARSEEHAPTSCLRKSRSTAEEQQVLERWIKYSAFGPTRKTSTRAASRCAASNRIEYRQYDSRLLGVDYDTGGSPPDDGYGFDNIGDVLSFSPLLAEKYINAAKKIVEASVPIVGKKMPVKDLAGNPAKTTLSYAAGGKLAFPFKVDKSGDYRVVAEVEVRGSFEFDPSRVQLVLKVYGQEKLKVEHGWLNQKKFRYQVPGQWLSGEDHRFELELTPLPPAKDAAVGKFGKKGTTNLQEISVGCKGRSTARNGLMWRTISACSSVASAHCRRGETDVRPRRAGACSKATAVPSTTRRSIGS